MYLWAALHSLVWWHAGVQPVADPLSEPQLVERLQSCTTVAILEGKPARGDLLASDRDQEHISREHIHVWHAGETANGGSFRQPRFP